MKTIAAMLTLGVACWAFGTQAQTFDTRLLSQYDASVLRELYPVCRHTTVSAEQQVRLAERIRQENLRFAELIRCDGGVLAPAKSRSSRPRAESGSTNKCVRCGSWN